MLQEQYVAKRFRSRPGYLGRRKRPGAYGALRALQGSLREHLANVFRQSKSTGALDQMVMRDVECVQLCLAHAAVAQSCSWWRRRMCRNYHAGRRRAHLVGCRFGSVSPRHTPIMVGSAGAEATGPPPPPCAFNVGAARLPDPRVCQYVGRRVQWVAHAWGQVVVVGGASRHAMRHIGAYATRSADATVYS